MAPPRWRRPARRCLRCIVQYNPMRAWLWCIRCGDPKLTDEQLADLGQEV